MDKAGTATTPLAARLAAVHDAPVVTQGGNLAQRTRRPKVVRRRGWIDVFGFEFEALLEEDDADLADEG